jgi:predicted ATPase
LADSTLSRYDDGAWFVDLSGLADSRRVVQTLHWTFKVRGQPDIDLLDSVIDALRDVHALIILDNCEHRLTEWAGIVTMLLR